MTAAPKPAPEIAYAGVCMHKNDGKGGRWVIAADPHAMIMLKRIFPRVDKGELGQVEIRRSEEVDRLLQWYLDLFPLEMDARDVARLHDGAEAHRARGRAVRELQRADYVPLTYTLAVAPRDYQRVAADMAERMTRLLLADDTGVGKQQPIDTPTLTPTGWRPMGDLRVGDAVIGSNGLPVRVLGVYPQGVKPSYRLTFTDGATVEAGPEHLWTVLYWRGGKHLAPITLTTEEIRTRPVIERGGKRLDLAGVGLRIPMMSAPALFSEVAPLPVDPYVLGQLLANGCLHHGTPQLVTGVHNWPDVEHRLHTTSATMGEVRRYGSAVHCTFVGLLPALRDLGVTVASDAKRVPRIYLKAAPKDRIALLQGLMDGDGTASATGNRIGYCTTALGLAEDVRELVEGLGGTATLRTHERILERKPTDYLVSMRLPVGILPFSVTSKAQRYTQGTKQTHPVRTIERVDYVRDVESVCIAVDAPDSLYVTDRCVVTHNTISAITLLSREHCRPALVVCPAGNMPRQWREQLDRCLPGLRIYTCVGQTPSTPEVRGQFPDVVICPYHLLQFWGDVLKGRVRTVVFDEVQDLRHTDNKKYPVARALSASADFAIGLSATPSYNYGGEYFAVIDAIHPGCLGSWDEFDREWCVEGGERRKKRVKNPDTFGFFLDKSGIRLRRTRKDVGRELPPLTIAPTPCACNPAELSRIASRASALAAILTSRTAPNFDKMKAAGDLDREMRQATGIGKAPHIAEFLAALLDGGERSVVCFLHHKAVYGLVEQGLKAHFGADFRVGQYNGMVSDRQKQEALRAFKAGEIPVLLIGLRAGSAGLDGLQHVCRTVVHGELDWSPWIHHQATSRIDRDGQPDPTVAYWLLSEEGSDPVISEVCGAKRAQGVVISDPKEERRAIEQVDMNHATRLAEHILAARRR